MFALHFCARESFLVVVLNRLFSFGRQKKVIAGRIKQVVVLYSNDCTGICLGRLGIGRLTEVVV